jgi:acetoacetate decarboxylase
MLLYLEKKKMPIKFLSRSMSSMLFLMQTPKVAMFSDKDLLNYDYGHLCRGTATYIFYKFREEQLQIHVSMVLSNNYILDQINEIIGRLLQAGIPDKIMRDLTDPMGQQKGTHMLVDLAEEYSSLSLLHVVSPFVLLFLGHALSLFIFICESAYHWFQKRRAK